MMVSVNISPMSVKDIEDRALVRALSIGALKEDSSWHFLWEGNYLALRFDHVWQKHVEGAVRRANKDITRPVTYVDNIPITAKYQKQFVQIFHGMTELVLAMDVQEHSPAEFMSVADRIVHCYFNMCWSGQRVKLMGVLNPFGLGADVGFEPMALSFLSHARSFTLGLMAGSVKRSSANHGDKETR